MDKFLYNTNLINKSEKKVFKTVDSFVIMKRASNKCAEYIFKNYNNKKIIIFCGPGNNGGDGVLIAQQLLKKNFFVNVCYPIIKAKTRIAKKAFLELSNKNIIVSDPKLNKYDIIVDAIFGTGLKKPLNKSLVSLINKINKSKLEKISIDMPSGVMTDNGGIQKKAIKANITLTFHRLKQGQWLMPGKEYCGKINILNIGLANLDKQCSVKLNFPKKPKGPRLKDHKYSRGTCLIIAGENLIGAAKLACLSASQSSLRAGSGICKLLVKESQKNIFIPHILEELIITYTNLNNLKKIIKEQKYNSIIYGCGITNSSKNKEILKFILKQKTNLLLDAGVFSILQNNKKEFIKLLKQRFNNTVMTPHRGEFKRIFKITDNKIEDCINASKKTNSVLVYKGNDTVIGSPLGKVFISSKSTPYLATAGSGDVLSGLIGGFLAQGIDPLKSANLGCYIHSQSAINVGVGLIASDLIKEIPKIIKSIDI